MKVYPYLTFNGHCETAFDLYRTVLGGEITSLNRYSEMPLIEGMSPISNEEQNLIMHITLTIGEHHMIMGSDSIRGARENFSAGNNFSISLAPDSRTQAEQIFEGLSEGGTIEMDLQDAFWGSYFGVLVDRFKIRWMINYGAQNDI